MSVQGRTAEKAQGRLDRQPYLGDNQGSIQRTRVLLVGPLADAEQFRKEAEECHLLAAKATSTLDKDEWLRSASRLDQACSRGR